MLDNNRHFFTCYSVPLKKFLQIQGHEYEIVGLNPESKKTFWVFFMCDKLKSSLDIWRNKGNLKDI